MRQKYQIFEEWPETEIEDQFQFSLFSRQRYWKNHLEEEQILPLSLKQDGQLKAFFCFQINENTLQTPVKAPYFEPYLFDKSSLYECLLIVKDYLKKHYITSQLAFTFPSSFNIQPILLENSCQITDVAISHYLSVSKEQTFMEQMLGKGASRKRRKLRQLLEEDYQVGHVARHEFAKYYKILAQWRKEQNHRNIIPYEHMLKQYQSFPDQYHMLKVNRYFKTIGLAIFIKEKPETYYTYILLKDTQIKEDINLLLWNALYQKAQKEDISIIEMGTSMLANGKINKGLAVYKSAIGGIITKKYTLKC
jgi:hypothetical protein